MYSVKYDSTELVNSTYNLQYARDHSAPDRQFSLVPYATEDGSIVVFDRYATKRILVKGYITAATPAALQNAVDDFKELFSRRDRNLDITPEGGTLRRYVANCVQHTLIGDYYNTTFLPYEAEFIVPLGIGEATALTSVYQSAVTANYSATHTLSVGSSPEQKLIFTLTFATASAIAGVRVRTYGLDALSQIVYDTSIIVNKSSSTYQNNDILVIDCDAKTVKLGVTEVDYYGTFPRARIGSNIIQVYFSQILIEKMSTSHGTSNDVYGNTWLAQSFIVKHTDATYRSIRIWANKTGTPPNALTATIEGDTNGAPDGSAVATFTLAEATVTGLGAYTLDNASNFTLTANTRYWVVFKTTNGDSSNKYLIYSANSDEYSKGNRSDSADGGSTWTDDYTDDVYCDLYFGGKTSGAFSVNLLINYYPRYL